MDGKEYTEQDQLEEEVEQEVPEQEENIGEDDAGEAYYVTPDRDDVYFTVRDRDGQERSLSAREVAELYEKVSQYEGQIQIAQQLQQYAPILNYVANDELSNRVILYRLQGKSPKEIVEYLYEFYRDMEGNNEMQPTANADGGSVEELKRELGTLKEYLTVQNVVQQNATLLMEQAEQLGLSIDEKGNYAALLSEISGELFGDPRYIIRNPLNQRQARVVLRELQERLGRNGQQRRTQAPLPQAKKLPKQFPGAAKAGGAVGKDKPSKWSLREAAEIYNQLLGG
jgi:hypothetical protein